jgi:hypothetical protein
VLQWVAEGLSSTEINERGSKEKPSFSVDRRRVDYYRRTRSLQLKTILAIDENNALACGLALKENRVAMLQKLAALLSHDVFNGFLWTEDTKGVGSGDNAEIIDYDVFNSAEIIQLRGILEDIAKEVGGRVAVQKLTGDDEKPLIVEVRYVETTKPE